ncbi:hypothetical protein EC991_006397 [Linnemannia zychae]|nr:hypothetical protein EC991_006397 [Linnemannia zychae]
MSSQDYRVSTVAILCRDCGNDVGLYPGKHKCPPRPAMPAMPAIPAQYQQSSSSSYSSRGVNGAGSGGRRPPDLSPSSLHSGGGGGGGNSYGSSSSTSRTPTSSSFQERMAGSNSRTPTATSFQERMKERDREKQLREREEREAAARSVRDDARDPGSNAATATSAQASSTAGSTLWNRLKAAKEVINATITGEEKWPESDDSDHEGETHVSRILREHADKREEAEMAKKIAELEMMPFESKSSSLSRATGASAAAAGGGNDSGYGGRSQFMRDRDAARRDPSSGGAGGGEDYYSRSLRSRGAGGDGTTSPSMNSNNSYGSSSSGGREPASANRYRTTSDLSRDDALSRLEGKSQGDKLATQVSHLGSTTPRGGRANSPNPASKPQNNYQDNSGSSGYQQQGYGGQLSPNQYSQRSVSPASNRRYDSPSPSGPPPQHQGRYAAAPPQQPVSPSYPNNNYGSPSSRANDPYSSRGQAPPSQPRPGPGQQGGRPDYDRRPTYPPQGQGGPPPPQQGGNNLGAYGQRQQYQQYQQQQRQQQYSSNNYF